MKYHKFKSQFPKQFFFIVWKFGKCDKEVIENAHCTEICLCQHVQRQESALELTSVKWNEDTDSIAINLPGFGFFSYIMASLSNHPVAIHVYYMQKNMWSTKIQKVTVYCFTLCLADIIPQVNNFK